MGGSTTDGVNHQLLGGGIPDVAPPMETQNVNMGQPVWKKSLPQTQQPICGQALAGPSTLNVGKIVKGMVCDPWGKAPAGPLNQQSYQQVPQLSP